MKRLIKFNILAVFIIGIINIVVSLESSELVNKIAILKNGDIWISKTDGQIIKPITKTNGKIEAFLFSPGLRYLAYSKIIKYVDEPGLWEEGEEVPKRAVCSIVILNLENGNILKEIKPSEGNRIYPTKWLPNEKLLFYAASGFDVCGFFEYDIKKEIETEIDYIRGSLLLEAGFHSDYSLMLYVDESKRGKRFQRNLHLLNLETNVDKILTSKKSILEPKLSFDKTNIAFIEVENSKGNRFDNLWLYNIKDSTIKKIYSGPAKPKSGNVSELSWSFDCRYIGMFFSPNALIIEINNPDNIHKLKGINYNFTQDNNVIFARGNKIYLYELDTRKAKLFINEASKPAFLR